MIIKNAEPFFFPGNSIGCLLIHGFTASPTGVRLLGEFLSGKGYTVLGIRLSGHGTSMADLQRSHWQDWSGSVLDGWHLLQSSTEKIFLAGLSMGGALALYHASFLPVQGVVAMSTPYQIEPGPMLTFLPLFSRIIPAIPKGKSDWQDPNAHKDHISYKKYPTKAILEVNLLLKEMRASLPKVTCPALLMHSKKDLGVIPENMTNIYQSLGTPDAEKTMIWLENSGHVMTRDLEKSTVFSSIHTFIKKILDSNS